MSTTTQADLVRAPRSVGMLTVVPFAHPQGCRTYVISDPLSKQALALDVHLDLVGDVARHVRDSGWTLPYVVDSHTHADHPSGAGHLAAQFGSTRIAHEKSHAVGVSRHPKDGETLHLGDQVITLNHAPGHTPDHVVLRVAGALFSGDTLLIRSVARTDFLGGDAATLYDTIQGMLADLPDDTLLYPGHDYEGRIHSTIGEERAENAWLAMDRQTFVQNITANPPQRPANMDDLLRLNREGLEIPKVISAVEAAERVRQGGATSVIDVRTAGEYAAEHIAGSRIVPLDQIVDRADEVRAVPAPRLLICRVGNRSQMALDALEPLGLGGLVVVQGGLEAYAATGADVVTGKGAISLERQTRIMAGALVVVGVALSFVHPAFLILAAFIGAGLVFAGVTDTCGMSMMLAKMPWNRGPAEDASAGVGGCAASAPVGGCSAAVPPASSK